MLTRTILSILVMLLTVNVSIAQTVESLKLEIELLKQKLSILEEQVDNTNTALRSQDQSLLEINQRFTGLDVDAPKAIRSVTADYSLESGHAFNADQAAQAQYAVNSGNSELLDGQDSNSFLKGSIGKKNKYGKSEFQIYGYRGFDITLDYKNTFTLRGTTSGYDIFKVQDNAPNLTHVVCRDTLVCRSLEEKSDISLKKDIEGIEKALEKINRIRGIEFKWKNDINNKIEYGFIAQEIKKEIPEIVSQTEEGLLTVRYTGIIPILVEAIKEQQKEIKELRSGLHGLHHEEYNMRVD